MFWLSLALATPTKVFPFFLTRLTWDGEVRLGYDERALKFGGVGRERPGQPPLDLSRLEPRDAEVPLQGQGFVCRDSWLRLHVRSVVSGLKNDSVGE